MKATAKGIFSNGKQQVVLTPLLISRDDCDVVCIAIRDPVSHEIVATALDGHDLAQKANIPLERAKEIVAQAVKAADSLKSQPRPDPTAN